MREDVFTDEYVYNDIALGVSVFFISILTTIGGVGGGGLLLPLYSLLGGFPISTSIPLSVATILGDSLVRVLFLYNKPHPYHKSRYLVDLIPIMLITLYDSNASSLGIVLSKVLPDVVTMVCILLVLGWTFIKSLRKAIQTFQKENEFIKNDNTHVKLIIDGLVQYIPWEVMEEHSTKDGKGDILLDKVVQTSILVGTMLIMFIFSIFRPQNICTSTYWLYYGIQILMVGFIAFFTNSYITYIYERKKQENYIFLAGDIVWNDKNIYTFTFIGSITGVLSTYMGIGGGMITTPVMIQIGMIPEVVIGSSAVTTFLSSLISVVNYVVAGTLVVPYAVYFAILSSMGSFVGIGISAILLTRLKRQSVIIFVVSFILLTSMILLIYNSVLQFIDNPIINTGNVCLE